MAYFYFYNREHIAIHNEHGLGILHNISDGQEKCRCFFEDGTLFNVNKSIEREAEINYLKGLTDNRWNRYTKKENELLERLRTKGTCRFFLNKEGEVSADLYQASAHVYYNGSAGAER